MANSTLERACELIRRPSVTPEDAGCQALIAEWLRPLEFEWQALRFGEVDNAWLRRGSEAPLFVFLGHTDVVPAGPEDAWATPPFEPTVRDGWLHGRGAADMKGGIAAMVTACERFFARHAEVNGSVAVLLTSDEEGPAIDGTRRVIEWLEDPIDWCVVVEPSSTERVGDVLRHGRRGSLSGRLVAHGVQGHVAYPDLALNPIHGACAALAELAAHAWDEGNDDFPPTRFQVSNIRAGTGATNVIPGRLEADFNLRYSPVLTHTAIIKRVNEVFDRHLKHKEGHGEGRWEVEWSHSAEPFLTHRGALIEAARATIQEIAGFEPSLSTGGGTSDARFVAPTGAQVIELGPVNATIHQVDERVACADLDVLALMYEQIMERLLVPA